ncbi:MAG TPA: transcription antitermination factor NusB [Geminicoccaceae bacterium]
MATASAPSSLPRHPRPAAARRRAARFAAVQALYQIELNGQRPDFVVAEFGEHRLAQLLEPFDPEAPSPQVDQEWFRSLVTGAWAARERLDPEIEACLAPGWTLARCGFLLRACLRAGAFELALRPEVPLRAVINEYIEVARLFFAQPEVAFVNAVLDKLAPRLRPAEPAAPPAPEPPETEAPPA